MPTFVLPNSTKRPGAKLASEQPWPFFKIALNFDSCQFWRDICICPNQIARNHHLCPIRDIVYAICRKLNGRNGFNPNQRPNMALVIGRWERNIAFLQVNVLEMIYQSCGGFIRIHNFVNIILEMNWLALQHLHFVRISYRSFDWKKIIEPHSGVPFQWRIRIFYWLHSGKQWFSQFDVDSRMFQLQSIIADRGPVSSHPRDWASKNLIW